MFCMDLAIKKAKEVGVAWVTCTGEEIHRYQKQPMRLLYEYP